VTLDRAELTAFVNGIGAATDTAVVTAVPGNRIRVIGGYVSAGAASSTVQFNTKPVGVGSAIAGLINLPINGTVVIGEDANDFQSNVGEGLTVTTVGAGPTSVNVSYLLVPDNTPGQAGSVGGSGFPRS
jgi:hypothetical protein